MRRALPILCTSGLLLAATTAAHAADVSLGLSNKAISGDFSSLPIGEGLGITAGFLHHTDNGNIGTVGLQVSQAIGGGGEGRLGGRIYLVRNDVRNAAAIALGGQVDVPVTSGSPLLLGAHLWYAPKVTSFNRTNDLHDIGATVSYRAMSNADVFLTWRHIRIDYKTEGGKTILNGPLVGLKLLF